jgi:hypothetical protein
MLARLDDASYRIFPTIQFNLYSLKQDATELTVDQQVAQRLLALAHRDFSQWERWSGWKLDPLGQMGHLLLQHRLAMEAELAAQWQRADFFWRQVQIELKSFSKRKDYWQTLAAIIAPDLEATVLNDPVQLRQRLVNELLIDTHCAFYNGLVRPAETCSVHDRTFAQIDHIQPLLNESGLSDEEVRALLGEAWQTRITLCKETKHWKQGIYFCQQRLKYLPYVSAFQDELAEIHFSATMTRLREAKVESQHFSNAKILHGGVQILEKLRKKYPCNLTILELLGDLHYLRAISLVNSSQFAESLVSIQKAITYNPYLEQAFAARNDLVQTMEQLQAQMKQMQAEIAQRYNRRLNAKGQQLQAEASKGFQPMNTYIDSNDARMIACAFKVSHSVRLWQTLKLPEPPKGWQMEFSTAPADSSMAQVIESAKGWSKLALQLWEGISNILSKPPQFRKDIGLAWNAVVAKEANLAGLDSALICTFLEDRLFGKADQRVLITPPASSVAPTLLNPISRSRKRGAEPLLPWLFSRQDRRIKVQAAIASILVLVAGGLMIRDLALQSAREEAYQKILVAEQQQHDLGVVKAAETFFANAPLAGQDRRTQQVMNLYTESLVRWFTQQGEQPNADAQSHLDRYRAVMNTVKLEGQQP